MLDTIQKILRGVEPGHAQTVGNMTVIPLLSDIVDNAIASPHVLEMETREYGTVVAYNTGSENEEGLTFSPLGNVIMTTQAAQNHAIPNMKVIRKGKKAKFKNAACVQQTQGGYIRKGRYELMLLPLALREEALRGRKVESYNKLWEAISGFNHSLGLSGRGHLEIFVKQFRKEMDEFVAQFEVVPRQVGAIILINGQVVGMERCPNYHYFKAMWKPLIRECYGSMSIQAAKAGGGRVPKNRVPLSQAGVEDLAGVRRALERAKEDEKEHVRRVVNGFLREKLKRDVEEIVHGYTVITLEGTEFKGQMIHKDEVPLMFSFVKSKAWLENPNLEKFASAGEFRM